jgi:N-methylhydantoinase A/oxoprolinase/acetone carboxylase beta subunit
MYRIGVDTGGTFTDTVILAPGGRVGVGKALSTKHDLSQGILDSIDRAASTLGISGPAAIAKPSSLRTPPLPASTRCSPVPARGLAC